MTLRHRTIAAMMLALCIVPCAMRGEEPGLTPAEFQRLYDALDIRNQPWATIDWKVTLTEARRAAAEQGRPVFLVVNTGNCLGFV